MKPFIIITSLVVAVGTKIRIDKNKKGEMVSHPFARLQMLVQSLGYKIYS